MVIRQLEGLDGRDEHSRRPDARRGRLEDGHARDVEELEGAGVRDGGVVGDIIRLGASVERARATRDSTNVGGLERGSYGASQNQKLQ